MEPIARIRADWAGPLALERVLGVPLVGWSIRAVRRWFPAERAVIITADAEVERYARRHAIACAAPPASPVRGAGAGAGARPLDADPRRPFCREAAYFEATAAAAGDGPVALSLGQTFHGESLFIEDSFGLEFARAVARGLPPGHELRRGILRLRLPLAAEIRAIVADVDGVLTDGGIHFTGEVRGGRVFNTKDGLGHHLLARAGIRIGWLSATSEAESILARARMIGVEHVDAGKGEKGERFTALCARMGVEPRHVVYLGDDVNDLPAMNLAGLSACPADAHEAVRNRVDLILDAPGGAGCFRELADVVMDGAPPPE